MSGMLVKSLDNYMGSLSVNLKNEKVREFLRYMSSRDSYFLDEDTQEEILETKNMWAGFAYMTLLDSINGKELTQREESFLEKYFVEYLLIEQSVGLERDLKGFYTKYRLSGDYYPNKIAIDPQTQWANHPEFEEGVEEYRKTVESIISEVYGRKIEVVVEEENDLHPLAEIQYFSKANKLILNEKFVSHAYIDMLRDGYDITHAFDMIYKICTQMELTELNKVKKNEISVTALIYTIEDYLYGKALKSNKIGGVYNALYNSVLANKLIDIHARDNAFMKLITKPMFFKDNEYGITNDRLDTYFNNLLSDNNHLLHYIPDARYFDTNNLDRDAFSKLFTMYVNGLKAMPKTKLTNVTKYFVLNGNALTTLDMMVIINEYNFKIKKLETKDDQISASKKEQLIKEKNEIAKVMNFIKENVNSYNIEQQLLELVMNEKLSSEERNKVMDVIIDRCFENYSDYLEMKHRVTHMYTQLDNLAGSNSPSKIASIRLKREILSKVMDKFSEIDELLEWKKIQLSDGFEFEDSAKNIVIHQVKNMDKVLTIVQELIGRGIITSEDMINDSIENGTPLIRNLTPGFKEFVEDALATKGVKEFRKKKNKK